MNFNDLTIGNILTFVTSVGVISAFAYKIFSIFNQVKENTKSVKIAHDRIDNLQRKSEEQKDELLEKVEQTNNAVNLLCSAISALIDNEISDNGNIEELKEIKKRLDNKKEIV